jgi:hypothetical protein
MMMWTKNAINAAQADASGTVHPINGTLATDSDLAPTATAEAAPRGGTRIVHVHEGTPEQIAYKLFEHILDMEDVYVRRPSSRANAAHRQYILETYAQCIRAVRGEIPG